MAARSIAKYCQAVLSTCLTVKLVLLSFHLYLLANVHHDVNIHHESTSYIWTCVRCPEGCCHAKNLKQPNIISCISFPNCIYFRRTVVMILFIMRGMQRENFHLCPEFSSYSLLFLVWNLLLAVGSLLFYTDRLFSSKHFIQSTNGK